MSRLFALLVACFLFNSIAYSQTPRQVADYTITYNITNCTDKSTINLQNATKTVYIKGHQTRVDISSSAFTQSFIFDYSTGNATILREMGNNKFISKMGVEYWRAKHIIFESMKVSSTKEHKTILGYDCRKAIVKLKDGTQLMVYYTPAIRPLSTETDAFFKNIPGFVLQYESSEHHNQKILYTAINLDLNVVPDTKFTIPKGYRTL